jgi:hypothetical protein
VNQHRQSSVLETADTTGPAFKREQTPPFQGLRELTPPVQGSRESRSQVEVYQQEKQLWYITPARVSLYSTNFYPWILPV